jgi:NTE family protein
MDRRIALIVALVAAALAGCKSGPNNSDPSCKPCSKYVDLTQPVELCPAQQPSGRSAVLGPYPNLVFEGGGVKGVAYAGAINVLQEQQLLGEVNQVAGTSAGTLTALLLALNYSPGDVQQIIMQIDFAKFDDGHFPGDLVRLIEDYGLYKGDYAQCVLECVVHHKTQDRLTTFKDLANADAAKGYRNPRFFSTNVNKTQSVEFSSRNNETVPLAIAARMSMSIPLFFAAREYASDVYVDGGVLRNYPIDAFDGQSPVDDTLGLHLGGMPEPSEITHLPGFVEQLFGVVLNQQVVHLCGNPTDVRRSVFIDPLGISATNFNLTTTQKCALIQSGRDATESYLATRLPSDRCPVHIQKLIHAVRGGEPAATP